MPADETFLSWWRRHASQLKILSMSSLARAVLAILASSSKSERIFSKGGLLSLLCANGCSQILRKT